MSQNTVLEIKDLEVELLSEKGPLPVIDKVNLSMKVVAVNPCWHRRL